MPYVWIALAAAVGAFALPLPWWVAPLLVLTLGYWLGPLLVWASQRMDADPRLERVDVHDPSIPGAVRDRLGAREHELAQLGFASIGVLHDPGRVGAMTGWVELFRHATERDLAHVLVVTGRTQPSAVLAEVLGFSRRRADGSYTRTSNAALTPHQPPDPRHDVVRLPDVHDAALLWRVHQHRAGHLRGESPETVDALALQRAFEAEEREHQLRVGYWRRARSGAHPVLRPTLKGALLMTWRMLPPWRQLERRATMRKARELLEKAA